MRQCGHAMGRATLRDPMVQEKVWGLGFGVGMTWGAPPADGLYMGTS